MKNIFTVEPKAHGYSKLKIEKMRYASEFVDIIPKKNVLFAGISGSVSYEPAIGDDVDIFIIARRNHLWSVLLRAMIVRRSSNMKDICLSLILDDRYASSLYREGLTELMKRDALHVIPLYGSEYYGNLLQSIPRDGKSEYGIEPARSEIRPEKLEIPGVVDILSLIFFAPFIFLKSIRRSHLDKKSIGMDGMFWTRISRRYFYYDSRKYVKLSRQEQEGEAR
ncbi:MAG: hypothetical protein M1149_02720 [Candidatus Thermoplasmatota archaeon]|jgi:hypothetical protein|nr:hypothetical protein [Candidatus Thermoplasmatota archaeon]